MRPVLKKIVTWGFVAPFWIALAALVLWGLLTTSVAVHVVNATGRDVVVRTCSKELPLKANAGGTLEARCFWRYDAVTTTADAAIVETVPFPRDASTGEFVYNVGGAATLDVVDHTAQYMGDVEASVAGMLPGGVGNRARALASLRDTRIFALPQFTTLVFENGTLPSKLEEGRHVVRLERPAE